MEFRKDTPIRCHVGNLFEKCQAVVFCGAGISLEPPAGLPDWHKLRDYTLQAIASRESKLDDYLSALTSMEMIATPGQRGLTPEVVASQIMYYCQGYFECFRALEQGAPNANHRYLAKMAKQGHLKYIVTTNFDLFLEQALKDQKVTCKVYKSEKQIASFGKNIKGAKVHLLKLHGCISEPATITATVEQQSRGLSRAKIKVLEKLLADNFFIFLGYSGADLKLDLDYQRMVSMKDNAPGFVWYFLAQNDQKEAVNPYVKKLAELYAEKAQITHGKLPEIFDDIVAPANHLTREHYSTQQANEWQQEKNEKLNSSLRSWAKKHISRTQACYIFGDLLYYSGQLEKALECFQHYVELDKANKNKRGQSIVLSKIGKIYKEQGEYERAIEYYQQAEEINRLQWDKKGLAIALNNIGGVYKERGEYKKALHYFKQAEEMDRQLRSKKGLAIDLTNIGNVYQIQEKYDQALEHFKQAQKIDQDLGNKKGLAIDYRHIGGVYYACGDYQQALEYLKLAEEIEKDLADQKRMEIVLNLIGSCYRAQSEYQEALEYFARAEKINRVLENKKGLAINCTNIASVYQIQEEYQPALRYYKQAEQLYKDIEDKEGISFVAQKLSETAKG